MTLRTVYVDDIAPIEWEDTPQRGIDGEGLAVVARIEKDGRLCMEFSYCLADGQLPTPDFIRALVQTIANEIHKRLVADAVAHGALNPEK